MAGESIGWGSEFWLENDSETLTQLAGVFEMGLPNEQVDDVEVTHYKSANRKREYIAGLIETGEVDIQMNYVPGSATDILCREAHNSGTVRGYKVVLSDNEGDAAWEIEGECYVKGYVREIPVDDRKTATLTIKFSGDTTEKAAA